MNRNLHTIFANLPEVGPDSKLSGRIFQAVAAEKDRVIRKKLLISRLGLATSMTIFLVAIFAFGQEILQSEFWSMVSLVFSDMIVVAQNWQDFTASLLETFPTVSVVAILAPVVMLLFSFSVYLEANNNHKYI
ncbi:MAG: hypothetical protein UT50_C0028G0007 [Candidatus Moranbacteria bacterium GW2011_GWA2_39_41]|nr:MAG: hypothetical protein UT50_C0028G0007 [Candidatus Moranbacteria bacterium GW2011_GWA2_39_41]